MSKLRKLVIGLGIGVLIMGCVNLYALHKSNSDNKIISTKKEAYTNYNHKLGESVYLNKEETVSVIVKGCRKTNESNELFIKEGIDMYAIDIEIINNSDEDIEHSVFRNFEIKDINGFKAQVGMGSSDTGVLYLDDTTRAGETSKYEIVCEVESNTEPSTIEIDLDLGYYTVFDLK